MRLSPLKRMNPAQPKMVTFGIWLAVLGFVSSAHASQPANAGTPAPEKKSPWVFSLLPKSLQKNPPLDLTVITEMTAAGKKYPAASPQNPVYYVGQSLGFHARGDVTGHENKLPAAQIETLLEKTLAAAGYLPAKPPEHPASLLIMYVWGSHNLLTDGDPENSALSAEVIVRNILDRAALVGGEKFAARLLKLFEEADAMALANRTPPPDPSGAVTPIPPILGEAQMAFANPIERFRQSDPKNEFLVAQAAEDCFYVVATAYDYAAMAKNERVMLWRTRMTANSAGVSQEQSLPTLITAATPFLGKEMSEPEIIVKRAVREGQVEVGTPTPVDSPKNPPSPKQ